MPENADEAENEDNWLGDQLAEEDDFEANRNVFEGMADDDESEENSIMRELHQAAGGGGSMARDKSEGGQKEMDEKVVQHTRDCLDKNRLAEKDEEEAMQKEMEG
eukprot:10427200-Alexandrium_andersonii.AAC.1